MSEKYETEQYIVFHKALEKIIEAMVNDNQPYCEANIEMDEVNVEMTIALKEKTNE